MVPWYLNEDQPKRILAIDGGGIRGALAVGLAARIEGLLRERFQRPDMVLADYFDLIGGTSTGAIVAAGLALGMSTHDLVELYRTVGPKAFKRSTRAYGFQSKFNPKQLGAAIREELGDDTLETAPWKTGFAMIAKRVDTGSPWVLTNCPRAKYWAGSPNAKPGPEKKPTIPNKDYKLAAVVHASAAAPFFFDMVHIEVAKGERGAFLDGAVTPHNNPALQLAMTALVPEYGLRWSAGARKLFIVSLGTGAHRPARKDWAEATRGFAFESALYALTSMSFDTGELAIAMLQWLGTSPQAWPINREVGTLNQAKPTRPLWTFVRYDAPLDADWLKAHAIEPPSERKLSAMRHLDDPTQVDALYEIGRNVGEKLILPKHLPKAFDGRPLPLA